LEFSIIRFPDDKTSDQQLAELLFDVYAGEGFSDRAQVTNSFRAEEVRQRGEIFVAEADGELLGIVVLNRPGDRFRQIAKDHEPEIHLLAVKSSARKKGIASALISVCEQRALALGFSDIVLSTQPKMLPAQAIYLRLGYRRNPSQSIH
jgi:GNAT superfamily N-acetyltransferase